jgi:hypothetical protein
MVYEYLWEDTHRVQPTPDRSAPETFEVHYRAVNTSVGSHLSTLPQWLWVSACFLYEGIEPMRRRGVWLLWWDMVGGLDAPDSSVLGSATATKLIVKTNRAISVLSIDGQDLTWALPTHQNRPDVASKLSSNFGSTLRDLTIDLQMWTSAKPITLQAKDVRWKLDLKELDRVNMRLKSLTVRGALCAPGDPEFLKARLLGAYQTEVTRLGKILVGEGGFVDLEEVNVEISDKWKYHLLDVQVRIRRITN